MPSHTLPTPPDLSLVVPLYYEQECVSRFVSEVVDVLTENDFDYEIVFVDDGSTDRTVELVLAVIADNPRIRLVELAFNHGKSAALTAGIEHALGDVIVCMDPDLQDPPEFIPRFVAELGKGHDLVFGVRAEKQDTLPNVLCSRLFWWTLRRFTGLDLPVGLSTMRAFTRKFAQSYLAYPERNRFLEGMFIHVGLRRTHIEVPHRDRFAGRSKFGLRRKISLALDAICDFSDMPLRLTLRAAVALVALALVGIVVIVILHLAVIDFRSGWPSIACLIIMGFGVNLFFIGLMGRYVAAIYREVKRRPVYSVRERHNVEEPTK